jgi:hypothetical protein
MAACRDCQEAQEEKVALKEKNRHLLDTLAKYREEVLQMKAKILALQQTNSELRERNVILQDEALEALIPDLLLTAPQPPFPQHPVHRRQPRATACAPGEPCVQLKLPHPPPFRPQRRRPGHPKQQQLLRREQTKKNRLQ